MTRFRKGMEDTESINHTQREGLETARCPTGVGSNPTPRTKQTTYAFIRKKNIFGSK